MNAASSSGPRLARAPNFFVLGGAKCGTTTLYHLLKQLDDVFLPARKEPRFFGNAHAYERGLRWYLQEYFSGAESCAARGEATPYLHGRGAVAERIRAYLGTELKFVVLLRDPVQRAWSHYLHMRRLGAESLSFADALAAEEQRLAADPESWFGYFEDGLYASALEEWFAVFPREQFLILLTDDLRADPHGVVDRVCGFLGVGAPRELDVRVEANPAVAAKIPAVATLFNKPNTVTNVLKLLMPYTLRQTVRDLVNKWNRDYRKGAPPLPADLERRLRAGYRDDIHALERLTGLGLGGW